MRAADPPLAIPDGARPLLQLGDLMNEADALDERPALPALAASPRALRHPLTEDQLARGDRDERCQEECGDRRSHGRPSFVRLFPII